MGNLHSEFEKIWELDETDDETIITDSCPTQKFEHLTGSLLAALNFTPITVKLNKTKYCHNLKPSIL